MSIKGYLLRMSVYDSCTNYQCHVIDQVKANCSIDNDTEHQLIKVCLLHFNCKTHPNVSSSFCTDQISFVKYEVCMVEDDHGEPEAGGEVGAILNTRTEAPPPPTSPVDILEIPGLKSLRWLQLHLQE